MDHEHNLVEGYGYHTFRQADPGYKGLFGLAASMRRATGLNASFIGAKGWRYSMCHPFLSVPPSVMEPCPRHLLLLAQTCSVPAALADGVAFNFHLSEPLPGGMYLSRKVCRRLPLLPELSSRVRLSEAEARGVWSGLSVATYCQPRLRRIPTLGCFVFLFPVASREQARGDVQARASRALWYWLGALQADDGTRLYCACRGLVCSPPSDRSSCLFGGCYVGKPS